MTTDYKIDFQQVKGATTIRHAIDLLKLNVKNDGEGSWRTRCPGCARADDRSLKLTESKGFYCHAARTGGDVIALVSHVRGVEVLEAARFLADSAGNKSALPVDGKRRESDRANSSSQRRGGFDPLEYARELKTEHEALKALNLSPETYNRFHAGYATTGVLAGRLAVRLDDAQGTFKAFCGITLKDDSPSIKFGVKEFDGSTILFNAANITGSEVLLVRDIVEVMTIYETTGEDAICFLSELASAEQFELLASVQVERKFSVFF